MKIEIGESLMLSWLKHTKECKVTQLNWKPSNNWKKFNEKEVNDLLDKLEDKFHVFKKSKLNQLIKQAEIDVLGLSIEGDKICYYAIDIAYHINGLRYSTEDTKTIERVSKKLLRTALVLLLYFNVKEGDIIFASPKIGPTLYNKLKEQINNINDFMKGQGYDYNFQLIANEDFSKLLSENIKQISCDVADTSELFMRALQLNNLCEKIDNENKTKQKPSP